jgi:hypothetical protein
MASKNNFFSYTDAQGVEVVVQGLAEVPEQYRAQAKHIDLSKPALTLPSRPDDVVQTTTANARPSGGKEATLHVPSFLLGGGTALVLGCVALLVFRRAHRMVAVMVGVAVMAALGVGYWTYVRRQAGLPGSGLATPATLLDDARAAADGLNKRHMEQNRALDEIDKQR